MEIKFKKLFLIPFFIAIIFLQIPCSTYSMQNENSIKWSRLNLTESQVIQIKNLDFHWEKTRNNFLWHINKDKKRLKQMLQNPYSCDNEIKKIQKRLLINQQKLRHEAMENFLLKRNVLTDDQRKQLHKMISN